MALRWGMGRLIHARCRWNGLGLLALLAGCSVVNAPDDGSDTGTGGSGGAGSDCQGPFTTLGDCGECGQPCAPQNASGASCGTGSCLYQSCLGVFQDCDGNTANGCESNQQTDPLNCSGCDLGCHATVTHVTTPLCVAAQCDYEQCLALFGDCDGDRSNGCERSIATLTDCSGCDQICAPQHATGATCASGSCSYQACTGGYLDCDDDASNGCETDPLNSTEHCGGCDQPCDAGHPCVQGSCG